MSDQGPPPIVPEPSTSTTLTLVSVSDNQDVPDIPRITLRLRKPKSDKKVQWSTETVDNEEMNKKKSKCCCIYHKPKRFEDSSSSSSDDSDDECEHCHGHVEKRKHKKMGAVQSEPHNNHNEHLIDMNVSQPVSEPT